MSLKNKLVQIFLALSLLAFPLVSPVAAHHCFGHTGDADSSLTTGIAECLDAGACLDPSAADCPNQGTAESKLQGIIRTVLNILSVIVGIIAVIMIIVSGLKYVTSAGDSNNVNSAKNTLLYAVVGLVIVALSQVIVQFVLSKSKPLPACPPGKTQLDTGGKCRAS